MTEARPYFKRTYEQPVMDFSSPLPKEARTDFYSSHDDRVVLLDSNNLAMRSFHAAKGRLSSTDMAGHTTETGSLHLFCMSLSKYLKEAKPTRFVACWDGGRSIHRERIYPGYKAARRAGHDDSEPPHGPAFALITEFLDLCGLEQWYQDGVEADDLIASGHRATRAETPDAAIMIMSADKDLLQLIDDRTWQLRFSGYGTVNDIWDRKRVITELGYSPEQIPSVMAFTGDTSDSVPGAKGIGPKKAVKLLAANNWHFVRAMQSVPDSAMVMTSRLLVDLLGELCCETGPVPAYDPLTRTSPHSVQRLQNLTEFCAKYQLAKLWEGVVDGTLWW